MQIFDSIIIRINLLSFYFSDDTVRFKFKSFYEYDITLIRYRQLFWISKFPKRFLCNTNRSKNFESQCDWWSLINVIWWMIFGFQSSAITNTYIARMASKVVIACMQIIFVFNSKRSSLSNQKHTRSFLSFRTSLTFKWRNNVRKYKILKQKRFPKLSIA